MYNGQAVKVWRGTLFALQAVLPENRTKPYKPYNPLPHAALGLYGLFACVRYGAGEFQNILMKL